MFPTERGSPAELRLETDPPDLVVDGTGLLCVQLLMRLRARMADQSIGAIVHVMATDPAAPLDLPAWCHLTGHTYRGRVCQEPPTYAIEVASHPRPTDPQHPWRPVEQAPNP
ncbi:MAG: sulfurtransferase TusA family protein [Sporichthyaceae bacterium]